MNAHISSRREILGALVLAPAVMAAPVLAQAHAGDADIIAAWERRKVAYAIYNGLPFCDEPGTPYTPEEQAQLDIVDECEALINAATATTPRGAEIQLWVALSHSVTDREYDFATNRGDLEWFADDETRFDWQIRLILSAIRSLRSMEA